MLNYRVAPEVQSGEVQNNMLNFWVKQLLCVINKTACRSILAGATSTVNASSGDALTSVQCNDEQLAANSYAAYIYIYINFWVIVIWRYL